MDNEADEPRAAVDELFDNWWVWQANQAMVGILLGSRTTFRIDDDNDEKARRDAPQRRHGHASRHNRRRDGHE